MTTSLRRGSLTLLICAFVGGYATAAGAVDTGSVDPSPTPTPRQKCLRTRPCNWALPPARPSANRALRSWFRARDGHRHVLLQVALCGNLFLNGVSDCDLPNAVTTTSTPEGTFFVDMVVGTPPAPCPCVIHVSSPESLRAVDQPFEVLGADTATPNTQVIRRTVEVSSTLTGTGPWTAWLGGAARRDFTLTVQNTGTVPLLNPPVVVTAGQGADPTSIVAQPQLGEIAPGASATATIPVTLGPPTFGRYTVKATVSGVDQPTTTSNETTSYPWALIAIAWLLIQIPLLGLYRRRVNGPEDPLETDFDALLVAPADYGTDSVSRMIGGYPSLDAPDEDPVTTAVVAGAGAPGGRGRRG